MQRHAAAAAVAVDFSARHHIHSGVLLGAFCLRYNGTDDYCYYYFLFPTPVLSYCSRRRPPYFFSF